MKNKIFKSMVCTMLALLMCVTAFAGAFSDVDANKYSWATTQIEQMANKGIINGYSDGTFRPEGNITKIEAMLLISRIIFNSEGPLKAYKDDIKNMYIDDLNSANIPYPEEIAVLLYKGLFNIDELKALKTDSQIDQPLERYDAAIYLTKAMGQYDSVARKSSASTGYSDDLFIPSYAKAFVSYVKEQGLMMGISATEFGPNLKVTRAQMAVMMYRIMEKQTNTYFDSKLISTNTDNSKIKVEIGNQTGEYNYSNDTKFIINGKEADVSKYPSNLPVILGFQGNKLILVECFYNAPIVAKKVKGEIKEVILSANKTIKIKDSANLETSVYTAIENCEVHVGTSIATLSVLRLKDFVTLYLDSSDNIIKVEVQDTTQEFNDGKIKNIDASSKVVVVEIERKDGTVESYNASYDIILKRNNSSDNINLRSILSGDAISRVTTSYGIITRLEVNSIVGKANGTIKEVVWSDKSSVLISENGTEKRLLISGSLQVYVDGKLSDVYSLRPGMDISVTTDGSTISRVDVKTPEDKMQIAGTVELVNSAFGFANIKVGNETVQVFIGAYTKITLNSTGGDRKISNIKIGDYLVVVGNKVNGVYEAKTVVIVDK